MQQVIVAFESRTNRERIREILESGGEFSCLLCQNGDQVRRAVRKLRLDIVVCGFKLGEESSEFVFFDLPQRCAMLMIAPQARLELCEAEGIFKLQTPLRRSELLASVRMLAQLRRPGRDRGKNPVQRSREELELVRQAKAVLMDRHGMTEEQAHRFLQKQSMDNGARLTDTARLVLADQ